MLNRRFLLDSSALILYFMGENDQIKSLISDNGESDLYCSILSFFEVPKYMLKKKIDNAKIDASLDIMRRRFKVVELSEGLCIKAAHNSVDLGLYSVDSVIFSSAVEKGATLVTGDSDFRKKKLKNVMIV